MKRNELIEIAGPEIAYQIIDKWGGKDEWIPTREKAGPAERKRKAKAMRLQGLHAKQIAERLGCSLSTVYKDLDGMPAFNDPIIKRWHGCYEASLGGANKHNGKRMT